MWFIALLALQTMPYLVPWTPIRGRSNETKDAQCVASCCSTIAQPRVVCVWYLVWHARNVVKTGSLSVTHTDMQLTGYYLKISVVALGGAYPSMATPPVATRCWACEHFAGDACSFQILFVIIQRFVIDQISGYIKPVKE